ncbi:MAG: dimethylsulfoniopropionate demethylase [Gammaproteobacteria bacterium]|jgi:dimethylsulfoniopropionate demethylase
MQSAKLNVSRRLRATPYTPKVEALGVSGYSVVNHVIFPRGFTKTVEEDYWHLKSKVQLWDVGCQRQVEIKGVDAARLTQLMTARDLSHARIGQCFYAPLVDEFGKLLNDPIIMKLREDCYWLSIADSDILLWAKGLAYGLGLNVEITEPDVWPLSVQGPKSDDLVAKVFGDSVRGIKFFEFGYYPFNGQQLVIARTGYSKQGGFEFYPDGFKSGAELWDQLWQAGQEFDVSPGCPNLIERVEGGLASYGNEMTSENNPIECGLARYCSLDGSVDYIGLKALQPIAEAGPQRLIKGIIFDGEPCAPCQHPWPVTVSGEWVGQVTTAIWSPRFDNNVALAMIEHAHWQAGGKVVVTSSDGLTHNGEITDLPMTGGKSSKA